jgi:hypothetical protein
MRARIRDGQLMSRGSIPGPGNTCFFHQKTSEPAVILASPLAQ